MTVANPLRARTNHDEGQKLGFEMPERTVSRLLRRHWPSQTCERFSPITSPPWFFDGLLFAHHEVDWRPDANYQGADADPFQSVTLKVPALQLDCGTLILPLTVPDVFDENPCCVRNPAEDAVRAGVNGGKGPMEFHGGVLTTVKRMIQFPD